MSTRILIDAAHPEETRVAVVRGNRIEEFDFEAANRSSQRGNIYLARVTRVEPSLQAAFVEYGGNRHGFLAFSEIHPDYYQIPHEDRQALIDEEAAELGDDDDDDASSNGSEDGPEVEEVGAEDTLEDANEKRRNAPQRRYKIQEVIKRRQILLVQVVKEERGNKGAALTTYISLAGRYCVLMPNTSRGGGVSRRISDAKDRKRLKTILNDLNVPKGMGCIIRTNGATRTKADIKRDHSYLMRLWDTIREQTLESVAPALIYEESDLIKRTIRDMYSSDVEDVLVDGADGYRAAKDMMKMLIPSHAKKVKQYKDQTPLFQRYQVERQLEVMYSTTVSLKSGGYLVINPTEALVAVDVNSGKSTRERNVERTAYRTNMEAAEEVARQLRLRDLAGLIVIDFIDMEESRNNRSVERKMKEALKSDRARLQVGRISPFGLMEMSRQRLRPGMLEASTEVCPICDGAGTIRSTESTAIQVMRDIEDHAARGKGSRITVTLPTDVAVYILNNKRRDLTDLETRFEITIEVAADAGLHRPHYSVARDGQIDEPAPQQRQQRPAQDDKPASRDRDRNKRSDRNVRQDRNQKDAAKDSPKDGPQESPKDDETEGEEPRSKRRRGRRGGRRRRKADQPANQDNAQAAATPDKNGTEQPAAVPDEQPHVDAALASTGSVLEFEQPAPDAEQPDVEQPDASAETPAAEAETGSVENEDNQVAAAPEEAQPEAEAKADNGAAQDEAPEETRDETAEVTAEAETETDTPSGNGAEADNASDDSEKPEEEPVPVEVAAAETEQEPEEPPQPPRKGWWNKNT